MTLPGNRVCVSAWPESHTEVDRGSTLDMRVNPGFNIAQGRLRRQEPQTQRGGRGCGSGEGMRAGRGLAVKMALQRSEIGGQ